MSKLGLVHRRMGHAGIDMIKFMSKQVCYNKNGFLIDESEFKVEYCKCAVCSVVKIQNTMSHAVADRWQYDRGEFYYVDFSGPFETSRQGNIYVCLFIDRRTRLILGFFAKKKNEEFALSIITRFREENLSAPMFSGTLFSYSLITVSFRLVR